MASTAEADVRPTRLAHPLVGYLFASVLAVIAVNIAWQLGATEGSFATLIAGMFGLWIGMLAAVGWSARTAGAPSAAPYVGLRFRPRDAMVGLPVGVLAQLVVIPLIYLPLRALGDLDVESAARETTDLAVGWRVPVLVLALAVIAPLVEEIFFRGLLQGTLVNRFGRTAGVLLAAVVFASIHFQLVQFPGLLVAGLTFGALAARYDRLGPAVWAHIGFNAATVVLLLVFDGGS